MVNALIIASLRTLNYAIGLLKLLLNQSQAERRIIFYPFNQMLLMRNTKNCKVKFHILGETNVASES